MKTICEIVICAMSTAGISVVLLFVYFFLGHTSAPSWYEIVLTCVVSALAANKLYKLSTREEGDT